MSPSHQTYMFVQGTWARDPTVKITKLLSACCLPVACREYSVYSTAGLADWPAAAAAGDAELRDRMLVQFRSAVSRYWDLLKDTQGV